MKYLKDAFAHAHKAIGTMTNENLLKQKRDPYVEKLRLLDAMRRQFSSHTLGITTGKWYFGGEQCVGGISTNG